MTPVAADRLAMPFPAGLRSRSRWASFGVWGLSLSLAAAAVVLFSLSRHVSLGPRWGPRGFVLVFAFMISTMGLVVTTRRPHNRIGWLYAASGLLCGIQAFGEEYAAYALLARSGALPGGVWSAWLQNWIWVPVVGIYLVLVPLLLPEGRLLSRRWRLAAWYAVLATGALAFFFATQPGRLPNFYPVVNPLGVTAWGPLWSQLLVAAFYVMAGATGVAVASLVVRVRQASPVERQQLKWVAFAGAWGAAGMLASVVAGTDSWVSEVLVIGGILGMHAATALAILRYRLYDIDVILRRTLVYAVLTTALAVIYLGCVLVLQALALGLTGRRQSQLATVLSTLAIAGLAAPVRARVQQAIDRRFYRRKYDAARALARFGQVARGDVHGDLDRLSGEILAVVDETLQPASVSLWVRSNGGQPTSRVSGRSP
jgi:hypothetical protein